MSMMSLPLHHSDVTHRVAARRPPRLYQQPWVPPDVAVGRANGMMSTFEGGALDFKETPISEMGRMGTGIQLYFEVFL